MGTLIYEEDRLVLRRPGGPFVFRAITWERLMLNVEVGSQIEGSSVDPRLRGVHMVSVPCHYDGYRFELAVSEGRYTALRSWVEAVPPGWNANIA